jgi:hypothetical protein
MKLEKIKSLKLKDSSGYDGIPTKLLKISSPFISSPLTHICKKSLSLHSPICLHGMHDVVSTMPVMFNVATAERQYNV